LTVVQGELVRQEPSLQPQQQEMTRFMPVMSMQMAITRREAIVEAVQKLMVEATDANGFTGDYGIIPGTKQKTLLNPGADKLNNLFGLVPRFRTTKSIEDWTGESHGGEPLFHYEVTCSLFRGEFLMGEGVGSANSWEKKYRYRKSERVCPACGQAAIIKGKEQYGGGWLCFKKKGGCGATFKDGDKVIEDQETGHKANPEIFDLTNSILKIANKRAKIAATLNATSAHEFFTQDRGDMEGDLPGAPDDLPLGYDPPPPPPVAPPPQTTGDPQLDGELLRFAQCSREDRLGKFQALKNGLITLLGEEEGLATYYRVLKGFDVEHAWQLKSMAQAKRAFIEMYQILRTGVPVEEEPA